MKSWFCLCHHALPPEGTCRKTCLSLCEERVWRDQKQAASSSHVGADVMHSMGSGPVLKSTLQLCVMFKSHSRRYNALQCASHCITNIVCLHTVDPCFPPPLLTFPEFKAERIYNMPTPELVNRCCMSHYSCTKADKVFC